MNGDMNRVREVVRIVTAHRQREGAGFMVRRPLPSNGFDAADPFLLLDEMGPVDYGPGEATGAPDHPHRGFETVTYMIEGEFEHEDSAGHRGTLKPGDVQWMTAGAGIVHSEMPTARIRDAGGRVHGFQVWVNLAARDKLMRPRYQELAAAAIPSATSEDGLARVKVIAGAALGVTAAIATRTPIVFQDWELKPGADVTTRLSAEQHGYVYVYEGAASLGDEATLSSGGQLVILGAGCAVRLRCRMEATASARLLLLAGVPLHEPVARYGPFVMNTEEELVQAVHDFRAGKFGEITRSATIG